MLMKDVHDFLWTLFSRYLDCNFTIDDGFESINANFYAAEKIITDLEYFFDSLPKGLLVKNNTIRKLAYYLESFHYAELKSALADSHRVIYGQNSFEHRLAMKGQYSAINVEKNNYIEIPIPPRELETIEINDGVDSILSYHTVPRIFKVDPNRIDLQKFEYAFNRLMKDEVAMRMRVYRTGSGLKMGAFDVKNFKVNVVDCSHIDPENDQLELRRVCSDYLNRFEFKRESLLFNVFLLNFSPPSLSRLIIVGHHWVIDYFGIEIIIEKLFQIYDDSYTNSSTNKNSPCSILDLYTAIDNYVKHESDNEIIYWLKQPWNKLEKLPSDINSSEEDFYRESIVNILPNTKRVMEKIWREDLLTLEDKNILKHAFKEKVLSESSFKKMQDISFSKIGCSMIEIILLALYRTISSWTGSRYVLVNMYDFGRAMNVFGLNISQTIGNIAYQYPFFLEDINPNDNLVSLQHLSLLRRLIPNKGLTFYPVKYKIKNSPEYQNFPDIAIPQVDFNFVPHADNQKQPCSESECLKDILNEENISLINNHPEYSDSRRIYFGVHGGIESLKMYCAIRGYEYPEHYCKNQHYHPSRLVNLVESLCSNIESIVENIALTEGHSIEL